MAAVGRDLDTGGPPAAAGKVLARAERPVGRGWRSRSMKRQGKNLQGSREPTKVEGESGKVRGQHK